MIAIMAVLKQNENEDGSVFRLVENTYRENTNNIFDIFGYEYLIQIKILFFWITIKSYSYTFDAEMDADEINKEIDYCKFLAEEYYEFIVNN